MNIFKMIFLLGFGGALTSYDIPCAYKRAVAIQLESVQEISNNSVGNDWNNYLIVEDKVIMEGECLEYRLRKRAPLKIIAHATEIDKHYSDSAEHTILIPYSDLISIKDSQLFEINVDVIENGGRHAGNIAKWKFVVGITQE